MESPGRTPAGQRGSAGGRYWYRGARAEKRRRPDGGVRAGDRGVATCPRQDKNGRRAESVKAAEGPLDPLRGKARELPAVIAPWVMVGMGTCLTTFSFPNQGAIDPVFPGRMATICSRGDYCGAGARAQTVTVVTPHAIVSGLDRAGRAPVRTERGKARAVPRFEIAPKQRPERRLLYRSCPLRARRQTLAPRS